MLYGGNCQSEKKREKSNAKLAELGPEGTIDAKHFFLFTFRDKQSKDFLLHNKLPVRT